MAASQPVGMPQAVTVVLTQDAIARSLDAVTNPKHRTSLPSA